MFSAEHSYPRSRGFGTSRVVHSWPVSPGRKRRDSTLEVPSMSEVTRILSAIEQGDPQAAGELLPLVYDELRKLATQKLAQEKPGQTLEATALVHEAYLRLFGAAQPQNWSGRGH